MNNAKYFYIYMRYYISGHSLYKENKLQEIQVTFI